MTYLNFWPPFWRRVYYLWAAWPIGTPQLSQNWKSEILHGERFSVSAKFLCFWQMIAKQRLLLSVLIVYVQKAWSQYHDAVKKWLAETIYVYHWQQARCEIKFTWRLPLEQKIETIHTFGDSIHIPMYWLIFSCIRSRTCQKQQNDKIYQDAKKKIINPKLTCFLQVLFAFFISFVFLGKNLYCSCLNMAPFYLKCILKYVPVSFPQKLLFSTLCGVSSVASEPPAQPEKYYHKHL